MRKNKPLIVEMWQFLWYRKVWWLAPIVILLAIVGLLVIFGQSSTISPFIYAFF